MTLLLLLRSGAAVELPISRPTITLIPVVQVGVSTTDQPPLVGSARADMAGSGVGIGTTGAVSTAPRIGAASNVADPPVLAGSARGG